MNSGLRSDTPYPRELGCVLCISFLRERRPVREMGLPDGALGPRGFRSTLAQLPPPAASWKPAPGPLCTGPPAASPEGTGKGRPEGRVSLLL